ncbi:MAG: DUF2378 family protein [Myxococcaceae bacterium]|nr:DUF2378 family protein [Myxococcaceae bacterium]
MDALAQDVASDTKAASVLYPRRSFDALLQLVRTPPQSLLESLRRAGFDAERPRESYHPEVWRAAQDILRHHLFPDLAEGAGFRALGALFVGGFSQTVVGRVLAAAMPLLGPERIMARLPSYMKAGADGLPVTAETVRAGVWRVRVEASPGRLEFFCGVVEGLLRLVRVADPSVTELSRFDAGGFEVLVCWSVKRA